MYTAVDATPATRSDMALARPPAEVVEAYIIHRMREMLRERDAAGKPKWNQTSLGEAIGVTKGAVSLMLKQDRGVGRRTIDGMLELLKMSPNEMEAAAAEWHKEQPAQPRVVPADRFPNRQLAAEFARRSGISEAAIARVLAIHPKLDTDYSPLRWFKEIERQQAELDEPIGGND